MPFPCMLHFGGHCQRCIDETWEEAPLVTIIILCSIFILTVIYVEVCCYMMRDFFSDTRFLCVVWWNAFNWFHIFCRFLPLLFFLTLYVLAPCGIFLCISMLCFCRLCVDIVTQCHFFKRTVQCAFWLVSSSKSMILIRIFRTFLETVLFFGRHCESKEIFFVQIPFSSACFHFVLFILFYWYGAPTQRRHTHWYECRESGILPLHCSQPFSS